MTNRELNRLKVVLAEKRRTNKWLAAQLGKDQGTISKWCTNTCQPDLGNLMKIATLLDVDLNDLVRFDALKTNTNYYISEDYEEDFLHFVFSRLCVHM